MKALRTILVVALLFTGVLLFAHQSCARNPLRRSDAEIRAWVLEKTPVGSTRKDVMSTIEREHWTGHTWYVGPGNPEWEHHRYFKYCAELGTIFHFSLSRFRLLAIRARQPRHTGSRQQCVLGVINWLKKSNPYVRCQVWRARV